MPELEQQASRVLYSTWYLYKKETAERTQRLLRKDNAIPLQIEQARLRRPLWRPPVQLYASTHFRRPCQSRRHQSMLEHQRQSLLTSTSAHWPITWLNILYTRLRQQPNATKAWLSQRKSFLPVSPIDPKESSRQMVPEDVEMKPMC